MKLKKRLGEMMIEAGLINDFQLSVALGQQTQWGSKLGANLIKLGFIRENDVAFVLELQLGIKWLSLRDLDIPEEAINSIASDVAIKYNIIPVAVDKNFITLAMPDPSDLMVMDTVAFVTHKKVRPVIATYSDIEWALARHYGKSVEPLSLEPKSVSKPPSEPQADTTRIIRKEHMLEMTVETLIDVLTEKGLCTRDEILQRVEKRLRPNSR